MADDVETVAAEPPHPFSALERIAKALEQLVALAKERTAERDPADL